MVSLNGIDNLNHSLQTNKVSNNSIDLTNTEPNPSVITNSHGTAIRANFSLPVEYKSSGPIETPLRLTDDLWLVSFYDLPESLQVQLNSEVGLFIVEPKTLNIKDGKGYKGLRSFETVQIKKIAFRFSEEALANAENLLIRREEDVVVVELTLGIVSQKINIQANINTSLVSMQNYSLATSMMHGLNNTFVTRASLKSLDFLTSPVKNEDFYFGLFSSHDEESLSEILPDIQEKFVQCCKLLGLPELVRPQMLFDSVRFLGNYHQRENILRITNETDKNKLTLYDVLNIMSHETYHASRTLYTAMILSKEERAQLVINALSSRLDSGEPICISLNRIIELEKKKQISSIIQEVLKAQSFWKDNFQEYINNGGKLSKPIMDLKTKILSILLEDKICPGIIGEELNHQYKDQFCEVLEAEKLVDEISYLVMGIENIVGCEVKNYEMVYGIKPTGEQTNIARGYMKEGVDLFLVTRNFEAKKTSETQIYYYFCPEETSARNFQLQHSLKILQEQEKMILSLDPAEAASYERLLKKNKRYQDLCNKRIELNTSCCDLLSLYRQSKNTDEQINKELFNRSLSINQLIEEIEDIGPDKYSEHTVAHDLCTLICKSIEKT